MQRVLKVGGVLAVSAFPGFGKGLNKQQMLRKEVSGSVTSRPFGKLRLADQPTDRLTDRPTNGQEGSLGVRLPKGAWK